MTFTTDPPIVGDIDLIPGQDEKADLNAPAGSGGKLVTGQIPNISISSTSVVADAAERLALDVQEGDVAIQTNVSSSFIFTGGDNVAPNWQIIDFDAIGAISGEDISPNNITALGDISGQDIDGASFANADLSAASNGELLGSDGSGNLQFTAPPSGGVSAISSPSEFNVQTDLDLFSDGDQLPDSRTFNPNHTLLFSNISVQGVPEQFGNTGELYFEFQSGTKFFPVEEGGGTEINNHTLLLTNLTKIEIYAWAAQEASMQAKIVRLD